MGDSTRELSMVFINQSNAFILRFQLQRRVIQIHMKIKLSFLFILLGVSAIFYATLIYLIENQVFYYTKY